MTENEILKKLNKKLDKINEFLSKREILQIAELIGNKKQLMVRNFISGISKGVGIGIGITLITSVIILLLQRLVKLNIPVIGEYITDIIDIVERNGLKK